MKTLSKIAAFALSVSLITSGCSITLSGDLGTDSDDQAATSDPTTSEATSGNSQASTSEPASSNNQTPSSEPSDSGQPTAPPGFILDPHCDKGAGSTGLDIYYMQPPSDSLMFVCVHRTNTSPYINSDDSQFYQNLSEVGGPYCAYSTVSQNIGCALTPITAQDLMNVPPQEEGVPEGYVLEDCQQGTGATGKTIYYRQPLPPEPGGRMHTYWFECVHLAGASPIVNVVSTPSSPSPFITGAPNPYCAFSTVSRNVGCATEPITSKDLINPS